jgi:hypothetical protein
MVMTKSAAPVPPPGVRAKRSSTATYVEPTNIPSGNAKPQPCAGLDAIDGLGEPERIR